MTCALAMLVAVLAAGPALSDQPPQGETERLIPLYRKAVEARPVPGPALDRLCALADASSSGLGALIADYEATAAREPERVNIRLLLGHFEMYRERPTRALEHYRKAVRLAPSDFTAQFSLGDGLAQGGDWEAAALHLEAAEQSASTDDQRRAALRRLGDVLARADRWDDARKTWQALVAIDPDDPAPRRELAESLERFGRLAEAIEVHRELVRRAGRDGARTTEVYRQIGRLYERLDDTEHAVTAYESALAATAPGSWLRRELRGQMLEACRATGRLDWLAERYAAGIDRPMTTSRRSRPLPVAERAELLAALADLEVERRRDGEAAAHFREALRLHPADAALRRRFADFLADRGRHADAAKELSALAEAEPESAGLRFELAESLLAADLVDQALSVWRSIEERAGRASPPEGAIQDRGVSLRLAEVYRQHGRMEDAVRVLKRLVKADPGDREAARGLAALEHRLGRPDAAREVLRRMVAAHSGDAAATLDAALGAAEIFDELGLTDDAVAAWRRAVEIAPMGERGWQSESRWRALRGLASALTGAGDYDQALEAWQQASRAAPTDYWRERADDQMLDLLALEGRLDVARARHEQALSDDPTNVDAGIFLAKIHLRRSDATSAIATYERLLERFPGDVRVLAALAGACERQGLFQRASNAYEALARLDRPNRRRHLASVVAQCRRLDDKAGALAAAQAIVADAPREAGAHSELAETCAHFKEFERALAAYDEAIRLAPAEFAYAAAKGRLLDAMGRLDEAMALYRRLLRTAADANSIREAARELIRLSATGFAGSSSSARDDLDALAATLQTRLARQPSEWALYAATAEVYRALGEQAEERRVLREALDRVTDRTAALQALMAQSERHGRLDEAVAYGEQLLARASGQVAGLTRAGSPAGIASAGPTAAQYQHLIDVLLRSDRVPRAVRLAEQSVGRQPTDVEAYRWLVATFAAQGHLPEAARWLEALLTLAPEDSDVRLRLAQWREQLGRDGAAGDLYRQVFEPTKTSQRGQPLAVPVAAASQPTVPPVSRLRQPVVIGGPGASPDEIRRAYLDPDWYPPREADAAAVTLFRQYVPVIGSAAARREALYGLIRLARARGSLPALAEEMKARRDRAPADEQTHLDFIAVVQALGDAAQAVGSCREAAQMWPDHLFWQAELARAARRAGMAATAASAYERMADLDPVNQSAHLREAVLVLVAAGADDQLDRLIRERLAAADADSQTAIEAAEALQAVGESARAAQVAMPLTARADVLGRHGEWLGNLLAAAGRPEAALKAYIARFETPAGPGLEEVWPSIEARRAALRSAWPLMKPEERRALCDRARAEAEHSPNAREAAERLAVVAEQVGRTDERLAALERLTTIASSDTGLPYHVIDLLRRLNRLADASRLAAGLLERAEEGAPRRDVCLRLVNTYGSQDPGDQLVDRVVSAYLAEHPVATDYRNLGTILARWGRLSAAIEMLKRALAPAGPDAGEGLAPADRQGVQRLLAELYQRTGQVQALRGLYEDLVRASKLPPPPPAGAVYSDLYAAREALLLPVIEIHRQANRMDALLAAAEARHQPMPAEAFTAYDLALVYRHAGRPDGALAVLGDLVRQAPTDPAALEALGRALMQTGRFDQAAEIYGRLLRLAPARARTAYRRLAECYAQLGRTEKRLATLSELADRFRDADTYLELAHFHRQAGEEQRARAAFQGYLDAVGREGPGSEYERYRRLAQFLASMDDADSAIRVLEEGARRVRFLPDGRRQGLLLREELVNVCAAASRLPELLGRVEGDLRKTPQSEDLLGMAAAILQRLGRVEEEAAYRRRLADLLPADFQRQAALARALADGGRYEEAAGIYRMLADREPSAAPTNLANAADALFRWGRREQAVETWQSAARLEHRANRGSELFSSAQAYYQLAATLESRGLMDEAERAYAEALEEAVRPTYDLLSGAVRLLMRRGKSAQALDTAAAGLERTGPGPERTSLLQALVPHGAENAALLRSMAEGLARLPVLAGDPELAVEVFRTIAERFTSIGDHARAAGAYAQALIRRPDDAPVKRALADAEAAAGNPGRAILLYRDILSANPDDYAVLDALARALSGQGSRDEAARLWAAFLKRPGASGAGCRLAGAFFMSQEAFPEAAAAYAQAVRLEPTNAGHYGALAEAQRRAGNYAAAIEALEAGRPHVQTDAQRAALERALLNLYQEAKVLPDLLRRREEGIERTHRDLVAATLALAEGLAREGQIEEARKAFQRVIDLAPESDAAQAARRRLEALGG